MLRESFTVAPFEQSPYAYRDGLVEIKAHKDFETELFTYHLIKGDIKSKEIKAFLWAFNDFFPRKRDISAYCSGKTFVRKNDVCRTYGIVFEGEKFKYNIRISNNTDLRGINFYIVVNKKTAVAAA